MPPQLRSIRSRRNDGNSSQIASSVSHATCSAAGLAVGRIGIRCRRRSPVRLCRTGRCRRGWCWTSPRRASPASPARDQRLQRKAIPAACARRPSPSPRWCGRPPPRRSSRAAIGPRVVSTPLTAPAASRTIPVTAQFWMMSTPMARRRPRIAPGHGVMPGDAAAALQGGAQHRIAQIGREYPAAGRTPCACCRRQPLVVDPVQPVGMHMALEHLHIVMRMRQHQHPARRIHHVVVQRPAPSPPTASARARTAPRSPPTDSWSG